MKKTIYADDQFEIVEHASHHTLNKYVHYVPSDGEFVAILPYRRQFNSTEFLVKHEYILGWDEHPDHCCISIPMKYQPEVSASYVLKEVCELKLEQKAFLHLGVCTASRRCDDVYYLYAVDVTRYVDHINMENLHWVNEEKIMTSNDSQLITLFARFRYML